MKINENLVSLKLNKKDLNIINELENNSRTSVQQIAKRLRLSRDVVTYRINKLKELGVISKFTLNLDTINFGYNQFLILIQMNELSNDQEKNLIDYFNSEERIIEVIDYFDKWDYLLIIQAKSIREFDNVLNSFSEKFGNFILSQEEIFVLKDFMVPKTKFNYDKKDLKILNILLENSRLNSVELGSRLKLSSDAIIYRMKRYHNIKYTIFTNNNLMGYHTYDLIFKFKYFNKQEESKVETFIKMNKEIQSAYRLLGDWNLFLRVKAKEPVELNNIMKKVKSLFGYNIKDFDVMHAFMEIKNKKFL